MHYSRYGGRDPVFSLHFRREAAAADARGAGRRREKDKVISLRTNKYCNKSIFFFTNLKRGFILKCSCVPLIVSLHELLLELVLE